MKQLFLLCVLIFIGCKSDPQPVENASDNQEKSYTINAEDIEKLEYIDYILSPDSAEAIIDWQNYQELQTQIAQLKTGNLSFFRVEEEIMQQFISEIKIQQPPIVTTPAIRSRMTVLETNLLRLQDLSNLDNIKKNDVLAAIEELFVADANLKLQMNKKFEKEAQQIQIPLKIE